jgi:tetratricopeptide (TPR) repeat protein
MKLPYINDYQSAVQHPSIAFRQDPDLKICNFEADQDGMPRVRGGNFAYTFRLYSPGKQWAVRCFRKYIPDWHRYEAISHFLKTNRVSFFIPSSYLPQGILVNGQGYPTTKMPWVHGETLGTFIDHHTTNRQVISSLLDQFQDLVTTLENLGIAHGDLQHGNILVNNGKLVLVDYDGMYVPELAGLRAAERGHENYQHPARNQEFGPYLDRFSSIVIYLALKALVLAPSLWEKYSSGENLLFRQRDFLSPDDSQLLADLEAISDLQPLISRFRNVCKTNLMQVPRLVGLLSGLTVALPRSSIAPTRWRQYEVAAATQRERLLELVGQRVTVVGQITDYYTGRTKDNKPYVFLTCGDWQQGAFRLVVWSETMQLFQARGKDLQGYKGKWVSVTGLLTKYRRESRPERPQIVVETPSEIEVLAGGGEEARRRLSGETGSRPPSLTTSSTLPPSPADHFTRGVIYAQQGHWDNAIREYHAALANYDAADRHCTVGLICWLQDRPDQAMQEYKAALKIKPDNAELHFNLGMLLCTQQGFSDEVVHEWKKAAQLGFETARDLLNLSRESSGSQNASVQEHFDRGRAYSEQGRFDKAIQEYQAALRINPNFAEAHNNLGWAYKQQGHLEEATDEYENALRIDPDFALAYHNLAWAYGEKGRFDKTIRAFQSALRINPNDAYAHFGLGWAYGEQGRWDKAINEYQTALCINPNLDNAHLNLGWVYSRQGRRDEAVREYQSALQINPSNRLAHFNLGIAHKEQGRIGEARRELEIAAQLGCEHAREALHEMIKRP